MASIHSLSRRTVAAAPLALPACWTGARAQAPAPRKPTPAQTEGFLWRQLGEDRELLTVPFRAGADGLRATFPIVIAT